MRIRRSVSNRVGTLTARETAAQALWRVPLQRARTVGWISKPVNSLRSNFDPSVTKNAARERDFVLREEIQTMRDALAGVEEEPRPIAEVVAA